ncbi:LysR family transcriptional regulator [Paraburkholderia fungorum]|uniref:LysR family transcriptional regulator n=2 Tax=Paraburkholderia fungorum TaxID=134537 RepID=UPI0038B9E657
MNDRTDAPINEIAVFVAVAQSGSFTRAAEEIGSSKSNVGKAVQRLEACLGTRLFQRTTRAMRLTEDGGTLLAAAQQGAGRLAGGSGKMAADRPDVGSGGRGVGRCRDRVALPHVRSGTLVHLLPEADVNGPPVHAIISLGQKMAAKTRAVVNHLAETLQQTGQ